MSTDPEQHVRWWDLPAALILIVAVFLTSIRLTATNWTEDLTIIQTISFFAVISGLALGQSVFSPRKAGWFSAAYSAFVIIWQLGLIFGEGVLWTERLTSLIGRLAFSIENLARQQAVTDPILFLFIMSVLFWILSAHAGFTLTRYANAWRSTLPMGLALFIVHIYDPFWASRSWFLASYIFLTLLLVSRVNFLVKHHVWRETRTHIPPFVGVDFLRITMIAGGILVLFAWTAPAMAANLAPAQEAWQIVSRPWVEARSRMTNAFASLRPTVGVVQDYYGDMLPLGRGNTLTDTVIFTVEAPTKPGIGGVRYYWRARSYETWTGSSWAASPTDVQRIRPDQENMVLPDLEGRWEAEFTFTAYASLNTLHVAPQPLWVSRAASADLLLSPDGIADILRITTLPSVRPGEQYRVRSSLTNVTESQLRSAGTAYPEYITERYLQIPDSITPRTLDLAEEIAAPYDNPYDITEAVTQYLRQNITYQETIPVPPQGQDLIDWLLFDFKKGFCNYYATAEIIMLRSLGIPARLAVGYAQGERDADARPDTDLYTVRQREAHAWPEVYFPGIGWVEFEPTINQQPLRRLPGDPINENDTASGVTGDRNNANPFIDREFPLLDGGEDLPLPDGGDQLDPGALTTAQSVAWGWIAAAGILILVSGLYTWYRRRIFNPTNPMTPLSVYVENGFKKTRLKVPGFITRMAAQAGLPLEARAYEQINRSLRRFGKSPQPSETPAERSAALRSLLPEAAPTIDRLIHTYHTTMYFSQNGTSSEATRSEALEASRALRRQTWSAIVNRFLARF